MAKKESTLLSMTVTLFAVTFIASTALGFVYKITKEPIAQAKLAKKIAAIGEVVPSFDNNPIDESKSYFIDGDSVKVYFAKQGGEVAGYALETFSNQGFNGTIKLMVGLSSEGVINNIAVLEHKETPGLGDKMDASKSDFSKQFQNKNPESFTLKVKKDGGNVDAITASTISSRAYCDAVSRSYEVFKKISDETSISQE